jgi:hypothetical protein
LDLDVPWNARISSHTISNYYFTSLNPVPNAHVCVYLMVHITKLQLQTTFPKPLFIPHFAELLVAAERLPKLPKHYHVAQVHTYVLVCLRTLCEEYMLGLLLILISKSWGCPPPGSGMPFLDSDTCVGGGYLFLPGFSWLYDAIHGWMTGRTDGWVT